MTQEVAMDSTKLSNVHIVCIPFMAPGHILPMVDMAKLLARHNVKVTIITTPLNAIPFKTNINKEIQLGSPIQLLEVKFPNVEAGIPEGCESLETLPSMDLKENFMIGINLLQKPIEDLFEKLDPFPTCIICDKNIPCLADTSIKLKIPRIIFDGTSCFNMLCNHNIFASKELGKFSDLDEFIVPGLPHRIEMRKSQLPMIFKSSTSQNLNAIRERIRKSEEQAYGVVVNSFEELEDGYIEEYKKVTGHKVWCVGPVSLSNKDYLDKAQRGSNNLIDNANEYVKWLDSWPQNSVIYICLGSLNRVTPKQMIEIGLGLEASNRPFIWVVRKAYRWGELEKWILESGFEERVKGRGILIRGWAPQVLILSHKSIGAFLTHCGWNSTLEGICSGVPLVTYPMFADQFYNEKLVEKVTETGVRLGAEIAVHFGDEDEFGDGFQVNRVNVKKAIEKVMGDGEEKNEMRERARKYADMAKKAIEEGGSSYINMRNLIEDIMHFK
ncbi:UDP-glycosyltransferase 73C4 [Cicer arietinum]|uniref:Glycosyltransferase n=1 Tax=Cicer arietinum TaxID=3827 RepID=A0A067XT67_CICAR|nr:UDP-glycosyltransferase 73C4 [Cicer arietinum]AGU14063.1 UDP-glycosyltransferase [Cicer arietinum]